jgi:hypothetical protein
MEMRRPRRLAKVIALLGSFVVGLLTAGFIGYVIGGRIGFADGYLAASVATSTIDGAFSTSVLRWLRNGQVEQAVAFLETTLDGSVLEYWYYLHRGDSVFDRTRAASMSHRPMRKIAEYRQAFPTTTKDDQLRTAIDDALEYARSHPDGERREDEANAQGASGR